MLAYVCPRHCSHEPEIRNALIHAPARKTELAFALALESGPKQNRGSEVLTATTVDNVAMGRGDTRVNNGIETEERSPRVAGHAPEGLCGSREERRSDGEGDRRLHG